MDMKKSTHILFLLVAAIMLNLSAKAEVALWPSFTTLLASEPATVKVLSINNSLIDYNDQYAMFNNIAKAMDKDAAWTKHTNLGKTLAYHFNEDPLVPNAKEVVAGEVWTHIILQEQSVLPKNNFTQFRANVKLWVDYIRANCPNPQVVIILPVNWPLTTETDYQATAATLIANYRLVAQEFGLVLCPVCEAYRQYQADHASTLATDLFTDDRHPTQAATYLAACMEFGLIYNIDPATVTWKPTALSADKATTMRTYAKSGLDAFVQVVDQHASTVHFEIHEVGSNGQSTALLEDAGTETFTQDTTTVERTYDQQTLSAVVVMGEAATEKPAEKELPAISITGLETISESFDAIGGEDVDPAPEEKTAYVRETVLPEGWRIDNNTVSVRAVRSFRYASETTMYIGGQSLASNAKNGTWNFGATGSTDRAIGGITSSIDGGARTINVMAHLHNDAGMDFNMLLLSYDIEKYRNGANEAGFVVQLYVSSDGEKWVSAGDNFRRSFTKDGNTNGAEIVPIVSEEVNGAVMCDLPDDGDFFLAWSISVASGTDCAKSMAFGIDNVLITPMFSPMGLDREPIQTSAVNKVFQDGQLMILRGEELYSVQGARVR